MNDISLKQLEIFVAVVEYGGFTRAAEELFFNQSTVSAHISLLEQALGKELFVRSNRRHVRLTKEGEQVYPIARRILNDCAALRTLFSDADSAPVVALGASTVPGQYLVPGYLAAFLKREPEFRYSLRRGDSEQVHRMLKSGQIAVGFVGAVSAPENLDYFPLYDDRLVIAAPNNEHYRAFRERGVYGRELLLEEPFVSREEGSGTDTWRAWTIPRPSSRWSPAAWALPCSRRSPWSRRSKTARCSPSRWTKARSSARSISSRSNRSSSPAWSKSSSTF